MPFLMPTKRSSVYAKTTTRFSKYKALEESTYFILQKRKTPSVSKRGHRPTFRIITKGVPYYEVAYDFDLDNLRAREWNYIINDLPQHMPSYLTPQARLKWLLAHFTQLALETDGAQPQLESEEEDEVGAGATSDGGGSSLGMGMGQPKSPPGSRLGEGQGQGGLPAGAGLGLGEGESKRLTASPGPLGSSSPVPSMASAVGGGSYGHEPGLGVDPAPIGSSLLSGSGLMYDESSDDGYAMQSRMDSALQHRASLRQRPSAVIKPPSMSRAPAHVSPARPAWPDGGSVLVLRGRRLFIAMVVLTNLLLTLLRDSQWTTFALLIIAIDLALYYIIARGEPATLTLKLTRTPPRAAAPANPNNPAAHSRQLDAHKYKRPVRSPAVPALPNASAPPRNSNRGYPEDAASSPDLTSASNGSEVPPDSLGMGMGLDGGASAEAGLDATRGPLLSDNEIDPDGDLGCDMGDEKRACSGSIDGSGPIEEMVPGVTIPPNFALKIGHTIPKVPDDSKYPSKVMGWSRISGRSFQLRAGPNYKKNRLKAPSTEALYEAIGADMFRCEKKIDHIQRILTLPPIPAYCFPPGFQPPAPAQTPMPGSPLLAKREDSKGSEGSDKKEAAVAPSPGSSGPGSSSGSGSSGFVPAQYPHIVPIGADCHLPPAPDRFAALNGADPEQVPDLSVEGIPPILIVHFQIPDYPPGNPIWGKAQEDGQGYSFVMYFAITKEGREQLMAQKTPASRLLKRFVAADGDVEFRHRFKCVPKVQNLHELNLGSMLNNLMKTYNGKPFLTGPHCHAFIKGHNYWEVDIDVHQFCYLARKAANGSLPKLGDFIFDLAFTVEGVDDDELPEQTLCCMRLGRLSPSVVKPIAGAIKHQIREQQQQQQQQQQ